MDKIAKNPEILQGYLGLSQVIHHFYVQYFDCLYASFAARKWTGVGVGMIVA